MEYATSVCARPHTRYPILVIAGIGTLSQDPHQARTQGVHHQPQAESRHHDNPSHRSRPSGHDKRSDAPGLIVARTVLITAC